jgi:nitrogen-specific signal transduction histidine kinase
MLELALHILDILQNAVEAGATGVELTIVEDEPADRLTITVADNGRGMDEQTVQRVQNPFYTTRTTRHVGLGIPLYAAAAETAAGGLTIRSQAGVGTTVEATFQLSHPDRQPLGDMAGTLLAFLLSDRRPSSVTGTRCAEPRKTKPRKPKNASSTLTQPPSASSWKASRSASR